MRSSWKLNTVYNFAKLNVSILRGCDSTSFVQNEKLKKRLASESHLVFSVFPRSFILQKQMLGFKFLVHNGKDFRFFELKRKMLLGKLGTYCFTKIMGRNIHEKKIKKKFKKK